MRRLALTGLGAALLVFVGAACQPITHPTFVVKEGPTSAVTASLVSGDGNFVVVYATAAGATVPSAGQWRVDRRTGAVVRLPDGYGAVAISHTGARILLHDVNSKPSVWSNGTIVTPPSGQRYAHVSADLAFALFADDADAGAIKRLDIETGAITPVETGLPRPAGTTAAAPIGISDDGNIAQIALTRPCCGLLMRFIDIGAHTKRDVPYQYGGDITDTITMAAGGKTFVFDHRDVYIDPTDPSHVVKSAWVELRNRATGAVLRHYDVPQARDVYKLNIAANGGSAWILQAHWTHCTIQDFTFDCFDNSEVVALLTKGIRSFSTGGGAYVDRFTTTPSGRFTAFAFGRDPDGRIPYGPARIVDLLTGTVEQLTGSVDYQINDAPVCLYLGKPNPCTVPGKPANAVLSDDGVVVVTTASSGKGWYESTPAPAGS